MAKFLINYDRYGYVIDIQDITDWEEKDILIHVAEYQNYWWQKGGLDDINNAISGSYEIIDNNLETITKKCEMNDCHIAFMNGSARCQCGFSECQHYKEGI